MLLSEQLGWRHDGGLHIACNRLRTSRRGNNGFAGTDVPLDKTHHRMRFFQVITDLRNDTVLGVRERIGKTVDKLPLQRRTGAEGHSRFTIGKISQMAKAHVVRKQLFECQP